MKGLSSTLLSLLLYTDVFKVYKRIILYSPLSNNNVYKRIIFYSPLSIIIYSMGIQRIILYSPLSIIIHGVYKRIILYSLYLARKTDLEEEA